MHGLIDAGLIGAERPAALQHERNAVASLGSPRVFVLQGRSRNNAEIGGNIVHGKLVMDKAAESRRGMLGNVRDSVMTA
jgi:hypothetical protein